MFTAALLAIAVIATPAGADIFIRSYLQVSADTEEKAMEACQKVDTASKTALATQFKADLDAELGEGGYQIRHAEFSCIITPPAHNTTKGANAKPV